MFASSDRPAFCVQTESRRTDVNSTDDQNNKDITEKTMLKLVVAAVVLLSASCFAKHSDPKVQVYSRNPGEYGKANVLICYVSGFHPPDITIELLKNGQEIPGSHQTDLAFEQGWQFHLTKYVDFNPQAGEEYTCRVRHLTTTKSYTWEPDM